MLPAAMPRRKKLPWQPVPPRGGPYRSKTRRAASQRHAHDPNSAVRLATWPSPYWPSLLPACTPSLPPGPAANIPTLEELSGTDSVCFWGPGAVPLDALPTSRSRRRVTTGPPRATSNSAAAVRASRRTCRATLLGTSSSARPSSAPRPTRSLPPPRRPVNARCSFRAPDVRKNWFGAASELRV